MGVGESRVGGVGKKVCRSSSTRKLEKVEVQETGKDSLTYDEGKTEPPREEMIERNREEVR